MISANATQAPTMGFAPLLSGHDARTVGQQGWGISALPLGVLLIRAPSNRMFHLQPLVPDILRELQQLAPGKLRRVGA